MRMRLNMRNEDGLHEVVSIANTIVGVGSRENLWKLVWFDMGLAVFAPVAKVVNKHGGSTLQGMHLRTR